MTDTIAALRQEFAALAKRLAQYGAEAVKIEEPPMLTEETLGFLATWKGNLFAQRTAAARLRYVEPELARLRARVAELEKAQERQDGDVSEVAIKDALAFYESSTTQYRCAREIARRRGLKIGGAS